MKRLTNLITGHTLLIVVLGLLIVFPFGCSKKENESEEIRIGAILPLSGETATYGVALKRGMDLAIDEINARGGIGGENSQIFLKIVRVNLLKV